MNATLSSIPFTVTPLRERMSVVALVLAMHFMAGAVWLMQAEAAKVVVNELSVSIQLAPVVEKPLPEPVKPQVIKPAAKVERSIQPVAQPVLREVAVPQPLPFAASPPASHLASTVTMAPVTDTEPDYQASYLHNPRPNYPMVARRMGWQGRVILNVEVLAEGSCGEVVLLRSSGHEVLDNAAMNTVKSWRFAPAQHVGHSVTQWFKVPINFSLEDNEA